MKNRLDKIELALLHIISAMNQYRKAAEKQLSEDYNDEKSRPDFDKEKADRRYRECMDIYNMQSEALTKALDLLENKNAQC